MQNLQQLYDAILTGDAKTARSVTEQALAAGVAPLKLVQEYMVPAMGEVGRRFECNDYFVPELLLAARAMKGSLELIRPLLTASGVQPVGRVAVGTVKGDLHDIGKNLVAAMLEGGGYEVIDLGVNVAPEQFVAAVKEKHVHIVALSALLTTTMPSMKTTIEALRQAGVREQVKVLIGGAPITKRYADEIGADGYGDSAAGAVALAKQVMAQPGPLAADEESRMNSNQLYQKRLTRYLTALRNEKPDMIPIRPFVAEFTAKYAGMTCQQLVHDYNLAFEAAVKCAKEFDWDAIVPNMVYVWTGLAQAAGLRYYGIPGIGIPHTTGFNFIEPPEDQAFMREDEYDALIDDPTGFLYNVWLPRISTEIARIGEPATYRNNLALVKSSMAMMVYFSAFGPQIQRLRDECGTVSAIAGIFKAPFDIIGDKLRGYIGLTMDMATQPDKVLKACEALMPHLTHVGLTTADPAKQVPIGFWMHRGCVPFISPKQFQSHYWPTLKPCIEEFWKHGQQTMFYAEGKWDHHLDDFAKLPERSILFHVDQGDIFLAHKKLHHKFALSGGIPNVLLSFGKPDEVRAHCEKVIDGVAKDGGYIMDASAIMQDDTSIENLRALTDFTREYGVYSAGRTGVAPVSNLENDPSRKSETGATPVLRPSDGADVSKLTGLTGRAAPRIKPGICRPWEEKAKELPPITGDEDLVRRVWENVEALGNTYIWQLLLSF